MKIKKLIILKLLLWICCVFAVPASQAQILVNNNGTAGSGGQTIYWNYTGVGSAFPYWGHGWTTANIAPGDTQTISLIGANFAPNTNVYIGWFVNNSVPPVQIQEITSDSNGNGVGSVFIYLGTVAPPCLTNLLWTVHNATAQYQSYYVMNSETAQSVQTESIPPGGFGQLGVNGIPCDQSALWQVYTVTSDNDGIPSGFLLPTQPVPVGNNGYGPPPTGGIPYSANPQLNTPQGTGQYNPTNPAVEGTNSPILYTQPPTNGTQTAIQQGDNALYTAVVNNGIQAHSDAVSMNTTLSQLETSISFQTNQLGLLTVQFGTNNSLLQNADTWLGTIATNTGKTNLSSILLTNILTITNTSGTNQTQTNYALETTQDGISNLLGYINTNLLSGFGNLSNDLGYMSNLMNQAQMNGSTNMGSTNGLILTAGAAEAFANSSLSTAEANMNGLVTGVGTIDNGSDTSAGTPLTGTIMLGTSLAPINMTIAPESSMWASAMALAKKIFTWVLVCAYALKILKDITNFIDWLFAQKGQPIPNITAEIFGVGGNEIGVGVWVLLLVATMAIYAAALAFIFTALAGFNWSSMITAGTTNPFAGADSMGIHLLQSIFPLAFFMGLVAAYLVWVATLAVGKLIWSAVLASIPK